MLLPRRYTLPSNSSQRSWCSTKGLLKPSVASSLTPRGQPVQSLTIAAASRCNRTVDDWPSATRYNSSSVSVAGSSIFRHLYFGFGAEWTKQHQDAKRKSKVANSFIMPTAARSQQNATPHFLRLGRQTEVRTQIAIDACTSLVALWGCLIFNGLAMHGL